MPAQRPRAQFQAIPYNFDLDGLVESYSHFRYVDAIPFESIQEHGYDKLEKLVLLHVIIGGKPLVIEGFHNVLDPWTFTPKWLRDNVGEKIEQSRDLNTKESLPLTIGHYLKHMSGVTSQHFRKSQDDKSPQRIYLKDIDVPSVWQSKLQEQIPPFLFYFNDSTGEPGGPGAAPDPESNIAGRRLGRGIAKAGDLMSNLPPEMRAENIMCYIGHEGTYTPAHREMCATMGHNIMVEASGAVGEDGKPEKPGSSIWFMTEAKDRQTVAEYWLGTLGHDIETENHFAQINSWKHAPFTVYIVNQKPGDLILIPPLAPHQVWNRGTRTMKVAWNRTTVETLEMAIDEALPKARMVCRDEQYKNKAIIYYTLQKYSDLLTAAKRQSDRLPPDAGHAMLFRGKIRQLQKDFKKLFVLFKTIILSEMWDGPQEKCEYLPFESNVTCAYCRGNIFNRFLSCPTCTDALGHEEDEPYDVCMDCYAMGRSCYCLSGHKWVEQFKWKELVAKYEGWRKQIIDLDGDIDRNTPLSLAEERKRYTKKTLAEVCKDQLKKRPFRDSKKPKGDEDKDEPSDEEIIVDDEGRVKKIVKKRSKAWLKNNSNCHVCCYRQPNWKMARCTRCDRWYCYGSLYRGHDDMPLDIMENPDWECAHCQGVCFAGNCRKDPRQAPYQPKGTLLGHDTKRVADARSVEALVDFSMSNLTWIREEENAEETVQMRRAREEAERAKEITQVVDDDDDEPSADLTQARTLPPVEDSLIDPALQEESNLAETLTSFNRGLPSASNHSVDGTPLPQYANNETHYSNGYGPTVTHGYQDSQAQLYEAENVDYQYPEPLPAAIDDEDAEGEDDPGSNNFRAFGKPYNMKGKRSRRSEGEDSIAMERPKKKKRPTEDVANLLNDRPKNEASRQYQDQKDRKALEEAKRAGRFFTVSARIRGRKRIVRLKVPQHKLAPILARKASKQLPVQSVMPNRNEEEPTDLLRSDVAPPVNARAPDSTRTRVRLEKDEDFNIRGDRKDRPKKGKGVVDYEEVNISSGEDDDEETQVNGVNKTDGKRRISAYIQAKHGDGEDLPDELPEGFKDSRPGRKSNGTGEPREPKENQRLSTGKFTSKTTTKPSKPARTSTGRPRGRPRRSGMMPAPIEPTAPVEIEDDVDSDELDEEEKNRAARLQAMNMMDDADADMNDPYMDDEAPVAPVADMGFQPPARKSIFDAKRAGGPGAKKIKIISKKW